MSGHLVLFTCLCTDVADDPTWLPQRCPGHDRARTAEPIKNQRPGGMTPGHSCAEYECAPTPSAAPELRDDAKEATA